jgi:5,10-methylene-tetrahydrofolate dehydrogenase/methenyl tetrahydrofolate cyclohydrolase
MSEMQEVDNELAFIVYVPAVSNVQLMNDPVPGTVGPLAIPFL